MRKKINIFLIVLIILLGGFLLYFQLFQKNKPIVNGAKDNQNKTQTTEQNSSTNNDLLTPIVPNVNLDTETGYRDIVDSKPAVTIPEEELVAQIQNKEFLEATYMALEYSKLNNTQLIETLKNYAQDETTMKQEDVSKLIQIHNKTFTNRYLKVFVLSPTEELADLNSDMRDIFYAMKDAFSTLGLYGAKIYNTPAPVTEQATETVTSSAPNNFVGYIENKDEYTIKYEMSDINLGIKKLEQANAAVNKALESLGVQDIDIEQLWIDANITQQDIITAIDNSNATYIPTED